MLCWNWRLITKYLYIKPIVLTALPSILGKFSCFEAALVSEDIMAASISILGGYIINGSLITKTLTYVHIAIYFDRNFAQFLYNFWFLRMPQPLKMFTEAAMMSSNLKTQKFNKTKVDTKIARYCDRKSVFYCLYWLLADCMSPLCTTDLFKNKSVAYFLLISASIYRGSLHFVISQFVIPAISRFSFSEN